MGADASGADAGSLSPDVDRASGGGRPEESQLEARGSALLDIGRRSSLRGMATKRLERTVIEGGRYPGNVWERRSSNTAQRRASRQQARRWCTNTEDFEHECAVRRRKVYRGFSDKLGPAERWLAAQVGRPWRKVHGELVATFDARSLAQRHVLYDHLLPRSGDLRGGWVVHRRWRFFVDDHGFLRKRPTERRWYTAFFRDTGRRVDRAVLAWLGERKVRQQGRHYFWLEPVRWDHDGAPTHYRQGERLGAADRRILAGLDEWAREQVLRAG